MDNWLFATLFVAIVGLASVVRILRDRRRSARQDYVPPTPGVAPMGKRRGARFRFIVDVEGYDDRFDAEMVERGVRRALMNPAAEVCSYDASSIDVTPCWDGDEDPPPPSDRKPSMHS